MTPRRTILILEDSEQRIRNFKAAIASLGPEFRLRLWYDAPSMIEECLSELPESCLISLDHDLSPMPGATRDPGTGLDVAEWLARQPPVCPVIIHTSHTERRWSMHNELRFGKWNSEIVLPIGEHWVRDSWLPRVKALVL